MDIISKRKTTTLYRHSTNNLNEGILACGMINKDSTTNQYDICFSYYGALQILEGSCHFRDESHNDIILKKGDFIQRIPGHIHDSYMHSDDYRECFFCIGISLYHGLRELKIIDSSKIILRSNINLNILELWRLLYTQLEKDSRSEFVKTSINLLKTIKECSQYNQVDNLSDAKNYMHNFPHQCWDMTKLANSFGFSYEQFRKKFKYKYNQSPYDYVIENRIRLAQSYISIGRFKTFEELALSLGYPDIYSFSRQFKKITTLTPTQYRSFLYH